MSHDDCGDILAQIAEDNPGKSPALNGSLRTTPTTAAAAQTPSSDDDTARPAVVVAEQQTTIRGDTSETIEEGFDFLGTLSDFVEAVAAEHLPKIHPAANVISATFDIVNLPLSLLNSDASPPDAGSSGPVQALRAAHDVFETVTGLAQFWIGANAFAASGSGVSVTAAGAEVAAAFPLTAVVAEVGVVAGTTLTPFYIGYKARQGFDQAREVVNTHITSASQSFGQGLWQWFSLSY